MANCCFYDMTVLGKEKDIERLISIMKYEDKEYYLYRVRDVDVESIEEWKDGLHRAHIWGDVAWSSEPWIDCEGYGKKDENGCEFTSMTHLSEILDLAIEWYTEEEGNCFAEHIAVCKGKILEEDSTDLSCPSYEVGDERDYRDGTKEDIIEDITERYKEVLGDEFDEFIRTVDEMLTRSGYVYIRVGGYDPIVDCDALWNGENRHVERTRYYLEE